MYDVIIIGKGPAGLSAALYTVRANLKTLIVGLDNSVLRNATKIENYFGFSSISGSELLDIGEKQVKDLGVEVINEEVIGLSSSDLFEVVLANTVYKAPAILIATGQPYKKLKIANLDKFEGNGVSYCTTCDGYFYRNLKVGVIGYKDYAIHEALELINFTKDITIFTNGNELQLSPEYKDKITDFQINKLKISSIEGKMGVEKIAFENGESDSIDGVFVAYDSASSTDFARKLGIITDKNSVIVDNEQKTNVQGIFAAGDCTGGFKQISTSVGQGALAAKSIIEYVRNKKREE